MKEDELKQAAAADLARAGVGEEVSAAGIFEPRGHTGSMFVGGLAGDSLTGGLGGVADAVGTVPGDLVFSTDRADLEVEVHQRVNVRVLELIHTDSASKVELEGNRIGPWHAGDVIDELTG